jgi:hypothetical protein
VGVSRGRTANLKLNLINYDVVGYGVAEDENWQIIDSMVSQFIRMNGIIGTWKNSTQYTVGDVTVDVETGACGSAASPMSPQPRGRSLLTG